MNCYPRVVKSEGSPEAQKLIEELMEPCDSEWRGLGVIPGVRPGAPEGVGSL